jgi:outer membrane biogenesis lipoprotein LolB
MLSPGCLLTGCCSRSQQSAYVSPVARSSKQQHQQHQQRWPAAPAA